MGARRKTRAFAAAAACLVLAGPVWADSGKREPRKTTADAPRRFTARDDRAARRSQRGYQEPAFARGYGDGYSRGRADGRERDGYDPVRHKDYREADQGYADTYGSKDAYKNNYRAGFRQGYEEGYRNSTR